MTLIGIIDKVDRLKPNNALEQDKIDWINELDGIVHQNIFSMALDYTGVFTPYIVLVDNENTLLVPFPYDMIYFYYLSAQIDKLNEEIISYNNNIALYNTEYDNFAAYYRRNHIPK